MKKIILALSLLIPSMAEANPAVMSDLSARVTELEEKNRQMTGRLEELEYQLKQLEVKVTDLQNRQSLAEAALVNAAAAPTEATPENPYVSRVGDKNPKYSQTAPAPAEATPESSKMEEDFDNAFAAVAAEDYATAKPALNTFIATYPKTDLAGEAYYWLGEIAWSERDYNTAAINYLKGYREYQAGNKAAENILKLALTLKELGKNEEACKNLKRFDTEFQDVHISLKAKATKGMSDLGCK